MSDSDDTDTLLLVPPNLYSVPSEPDEKIEVSVVEDLINHVERLETRVNHIETRTSLLGSSIDPSSHDELSSRSTETASNQTPQTVFAAGLDFRTDVNRDDKAALLSEVDQYLVEINVPDMNNSLESAVESRRGSGEKILNQIASPGFGKHLALPDVDKLLREMETTQNEIEKKLRARENDYGLGDLRLSESPKRVGLRELTSQRADKYYDVGTKNKFTGVKNDFVSSRRAFILGENIGSIPDLGLGVRELFAPTTSPRKPDDRLPVVEETMKRDAYLVGSSNNEEDVREPSVSRSPNKSSPQTVPLNLETRRTRAFSPRKKLPFSDGLSSRMGPSTTVGVSGAHSERNVQLEGGGDMDPARFRSERPPFQHKLASEFRGNLMSLADLWKNESISTMDDPSKLRQKLEEEKFRRIHLEEAIQTLNKKVLEEQEKLAVAMVVDEGKDKAILQITDAWKQMVEHWKRIEADRHAMSQQLISEKTILKRAREEVDKKIERWEKEVSQALDLAAGYKSKCEFLESELNVNKEVLEGKLSDLKEKLEVKEKTLTDLLEERKALSEQLAVALEDIEEKKLLVDSAQRETEAIQVNLSRMEAELTLAKEQKGLIEMRLMEEKGRVVVLEKRKNFLEEKLEESEQLQAKAQEEAKQATTELETCKTDLRNLYQSQLEMVVRSKLTEFQSQLDAAQLAMQAEIESTKEIAQRKAEEQQNALVDGHVAEIRRLEAVHKEEIRAIEYRLAESERRRMKLENNHKEIAQKLHGVMENQWQQALNILTSEISMRQPHNELEKMMKPNFQPDRLVSKNPYDKPSHESESSDEPFNKDDLVTCRSGPSKQPPPSKQEQLFKYIQMLLDKQPGKAVDSSSMLDTSLSVADGHVDRSPWPQRLDDVQENGNPSHSTHPNRKPPWK